MYPIFASSVDGDATGSITLLMIIGFAVILLVNRSNSPARYADQYRRDFEDPADAYRYRDAAYRDYSRDERTRGGLGMGILIFGLGAVMRYGVTASVHGLDLHTVGNILMIIGAISIVGSVLFYGLGRARRRDI